MAGEIRDILTDQSVCGVTEFVLMWLCNYSLGLSESAASGTSGQENMSSAPKDNREGTQVTLSGTPGPLPTLLHCYILCQHRGVCVCACMCVHLKKKIPRMPVTILNAAPVDLYIRWPSRPDSDNNCSALFLTATSYSHSTLCWSCSRNALL